MKKVAAVVGVILLVLAGGSACKQGEDWVVPPSVGESDD